MTFTPKKQGLEASLMSSDGKGNHVRYTILGPWDADPDKNILSHNSKFAQAMIGRKKGESFTFREDKYQILDLGSYLKQ